MRQYAVLVVLLFTVLWGQGFTHNVSQLIFCADVIERVVNKHNIAVLVQKECVTGRFFRLVMVLLGKLTFAVYVYRVINNLYLILKSFLSVSNNSF